MATLAEIAHTVQGELRGPPDLVVTGVGSVGGAGPECIAPVENERFLPGVPLSKAAAFLLPPKLADRIDRPRVIVKHTLVALNRVMEMLGLMPPPVPPGIHPAAIVEKGAVVPNSCTVGPYAVIQAGARLGERCVVDSHAVIEGDVVMGDDCRIQVGAVLHNGSVLGNRVRVGSHSVISRQGFGFAAGATGPVLLHHVGRVHLEDDVHVGAGCAVDRARFDETRIGTMSALDNMVHLGHNTAVGARTFIAAQTGLAGNARIGDDCEVGGQVGIANHCGVGDRCRIAAKSGVTKMFENDQIVYWYPAEERKLVQRMLIALRRLARDEEAAERD